MATEVKERSVPKPVFTDAEAGAQEFPSWQSRSYNYFTPRKRRATVYEDVTVDVQPDPERHLTQGWVYAFANGDSGYPQDWTALKSSNWHEFLDPNEEWEQTIYRNNANVVRQISQNIEQGRLAGAFSAVQPRLGARAREARVRVGARRARHRDARLHARPARRADEHDQQRDGRRRRAQAALRAGPDPLQPDALGRDRRLRRVDPQADVAGGPGLAADARADRAADRHPRLVRGAVRDDRRLRAAGRRAVPLRLRDAGRGAARRLRDPDDHRRRRGRRGARAARGARAVPDARRRRGPRRRQQGDHAGLAGDYVPRAVAAGAHAAADLVAAVREGHPLRGLLRALARPAWRRCWARSASRLPRRCRHDRVRLRPHVVEHGRRHADEQPGRLRRRRGDARQGRREGHRAAVDDPRRRRRTRSTSTTRRSPRRSAGTTSATTTSRRSCRTHYGRMVVLDDRVSLFANPEDAAEYIGFDLQPVE